MNVDELWDKLELEKNSDIDWAAEFAGTNGADELRKRVTRRLNDGDSYETAERVFAEELDNV